MDTNIVQQAASVLIAEDVRKLTYDLMSNINWTDVIGAVVGLYLTAKGLRNKTPLGYGKFAPFLNLLNLEAKPAQVVNQQLQAEQTPVAIVPKAVDAVQTPKVP